MWRQGGVAANAAPEISRLTAEMLEGADSDDPFAGLDDEDELDANELVLVDGGLNSQSAKKLCFYV